MPFKRKKKVWNKTRWSSTVDLKHVCGLGSIASNIAKSKLIEIRTFTIGNVLEARPTHEVHPAARYNVYNAAAVLNRNDVKPSTWFEDRTCHVIATKNHSTIFGVLFDYDYNFFFFLAYA